jgi:hypothetical protein
MTADTGISLDPDALHTEAARASGLDDYGPDQSYRKPMSVFLQSVGDAGRGPGFEQAAHDRALHILTTRLHFVEHAKEHPEVLDERIERPVILIGLPRTGTTILYDVLALDPAARPPLEWEAQIPWPPPEAATFATDERIALVQAGVDHLVSVAPEVLETHPMGAHLPAECNTIMEYHFSGPDWWARFGTDPYTEWVATQRAEGCYRTHLRFLQHLQWHGPRGRWTLKSPAHLFDLEGLLATYPDACLVWTHRDPATVMASLAAFVRPFRRLLGADDDKLRMGGSTTLLWGNALERGVLSRGHPRVEAAVFDLPFKEVQADPAAAATRVHEHFGLPFTEEHRARMAAFLADHALGSTGSQRYTFAEFGVDPDAIRARFPAYCNRFADLF